MKVTIVYEITNVTEWFKHNLHCEHNGLKAVRVAYGDCTDARDALEQLLPFVEEDYIESCATPAHKAAVEHSRRALA